MVRWLRDRFRKQTPSEVEQSLLTKLDAVVSSFQVGYKDFRISRSPLYWRVDVPINSYQGYKTESASLNEAVESMIHVLSDLLKDRQKRLN